MPHIEEAQAGNIRDVEKYLTKLKQNLKIGEQGFPTKVAIGGDQQTYAIMKNLQRKYTARFSWYFAVPRPWHLLKLVSEVLRDMLWDGGLREFSYKCGQKSIPKQWQDIHLLLLATYESLLRKATTEFLEVAEKCACGNPHSDVAFWQWVEMISKPNNDDKSSQFWAQLCCSYL